MTPPEELGECKDGEAGTTSRHFRAWGHRWLLRAGNKICGRQLPAPAAEREETEETETASLNSVNVVADIHDKG